ncbi:MAG TPA: SDR family oxidoreductase [Steroidobacteraceae bacterium]|nr:SDR family oxidoreductase [Steroidobacteraceae bacterium]
MRVLVCGASGFIGTALTQALRRAGHDVIRGVRRPAGPQDLAIDYATDTNPEVWLPRLAGVDAVINAIGIIAERPGSLFIDLHQRAPIALFRACATAGVRRVVQISALGADTGDTGYFRTKFAADTALMQLSLDWQILRPSLVYGENGASAAAFRRLATLPVIALPALPSTARFQPVHIDDLAAAVVAVLGADTPSRQCIACAGATSHTLRGMIGAYRGFFGLGPALWLSIPRPVMGIAARIAGWIPGLPLNPETWRMLQQGSAADAAAFERLLGHPPRGLDGFIRGSDAERLGMRALREWQLPLLRMSLAAVWLISAVASAFIHPQADSLAMLARTGLTGTLAMIALYGSAALDFALGVATMLWPRRSTWLAQAALIIAYTIIIAFALPEWLSHPFAPVVKNLPMLAILAMLLAGEPKWTTSR